MRRLAATFALAIALLSPSLAFADDPPPAPPVATVYIAPIITPIGKGAPAPFAGVLLTPEAVARVIADAKDCPKRIQVEVDHAQGVERASGAKALADAQSDAKRDHEVLQAGIDQRDGNIKDLTSRLQKAENASSNGWLWAGGGVLMGAVIVTLSIVAVGAAK